MYSLSVGCEHLSVKQNFNNSTFNKIHALLTENIVSVLEYAALEI